MSRDRRLVRRQPGRGRYDRSSIDEVLDTGLVAHVAFVDDGQPYCIPMMYARLDDSVFIHGSTASRATKTLATGAPACLTVTHVDGLVLARSAFEHSANYRSAILVGRFQAVARKELKERAFEAFTNKVVPGRWNEVREPNPKELRSSMILEMPIDEAAVKVRTGPPSDDDSPDASLPTWAGVVPLETTVGTPTPSPGLAAGIPVPESVRRLAVRLMPPRENGGVASLSHGDH